MVSNCCFVHRNSHINVSTPTKLVFIVNVRAIIVDSIYLLLVHRKICMVDWLENQDESWREISKLTQKNAFRAASTFGQG